MQRVLVFCVLLTLLCTDSVRLEARSRESLNSGWRFARFGAMPDGTTRAEPEGLENGTLDDSDWRPLYLPHDWAIEGPFRDDLPNRTGKLPYEGIGWYRKTFTVPMSDRGKRIFIDIDGAMSRAQVYINGQYAGQWPYGYASFRIELTEHIRFGEENTIAVRLDNPGESSRWYPGGGIYRNVWLVKTAPVHVAHWGVCITTPEVREDLGNVRAQVELEGATAATTVRHEIRPSGSGDVVTRGEGEDCTLLVPSPRLWDIESPHLYTLRTTVLEEGNVVDVVENDFGIRTIEFTADRGFLLNGRAVKMNGVCMHHDLGPLGAAFNTRAAERQIELLKEMGCNAIRTAHNPPAPEYVDLCSRMGMLVQVESFDCWKAGKTENDYSSLFPEWHKRDIEAMIRRDRNQPSVVMWSTGNEVREQNKPEGHAVSQMLSDLVRSIDPTRPTTVGCNNQNSGKNGFQKTVDVFGYNYKPHLYESFQKNNPEQPLYGSETASTVSSRGEYFFPVSDEKHMGQGGYFQVSSYDLTAPPWANNPDIEFEAQDRCPYVIGEFVWTGFDYIGEPTPYNKDSTNLLNFADPEERQRMEKELERLGSKIPPRSSYFGILDLCGFKKDRFYIYKARWRPDLPMAHILPHWNWPERIGKVTPVHVYTSGDEAELFLNGRSLGRKKKGDLEYRLRWDDVVYQPGELKVVAYKDAARWAEDTMKTTGAPAKIDLRADRSLIDSDGRDLSFITVQISDAQGLLVPRSNNEVQFELEGPGEILAVGSGDPTSHESFQASKRKAFNGLCLVIVRSRAGESGEIRLSATSDGLGKARLQIESKE
ncbi:Evolved beta-galactosidase subunit alpha [Planctomycetes bacterium CA13]|uniref:Evolved beta-galactosidase subunit alpha n=1 Tax=Novipirellula herctigrandis TaxID=2527986 RepID=A0A5C5ZA04_9BACT|nr:Evolved beta-galactosidase subunit alpha [Planctomycetes bacterium CA13]